MNITKKPLLELVEKLMSESYVKKPICALCFELLKNNQIRVFTIRKEMNQRDEELYENNHIDLTLNKFSLRSKRTGRIDTIDQEADSFNQFVKPVVHESSNPAVADIISEVEHTVLINELLRTKYMSNSEIMQNDYDTELNVQLNDKDLSFGYIGIHPYTKKYEKTKEGTKLYLSIYWGIREFTKLDPDADRVPSDKIPL